MAKYNCKTCGAELYFNPKTGKMECEYCGSSFDPSEYAYQTEQDSADVKPAAYVDESEPVTEPATDDSTGDLRIYKCPHCGAEVITSKETAATTCVYCNRAITLSGNLTGQPRDYTVGESYRCFQTGLRTSFYQGTEGCGRSLSEALQKIDPHSPPLYQEIHDRED